MIRARFKANVADYRPVKFPPKHPWWCTGYTGEEENPIIVAYADDKDYILEHWPEATDIQFDEAESYQFTGRFPKPEWFNET